MRAVAELVTRTSQAWTKEFKFAGKSVSRTVLIYGLQGEDAAELGASTRQAAGACGRG